MAKRAISVAKGGFFGYLFAALLSIVGVMLIASVFFITGQHSLSLRVGPVPFMEAWNNSGGFGFASDWGVGVTSALGAVVGVGLALRKEQVRA
jgi:hypothetical protein